MLRDLRRLAVSRSLFPPTTLSDAVRRLGFVQADPIRAPARAQDLALRHRVTGYLTGDLERCYSQLDVEEDVFINYGYVPRCVQALMHPRTATALSATARNKRERELMKFIRERGEVHPRAVDSHFSHGTVTNYWGGSSRATTHLLESMHYRGLIRVARRDQGIRIYAVREHAAASAGAAARRAQIDALVDVLVRTYAPLPRASLSAMISRLRYAVPQWCGELKSASQRALKRLAHARVEEIDWYWPAEEQLPCDAPDQCVRLLSPFDPVVWDRRRFERLWGWPYRFEAYTPGPARKLGYYALPVLWRDDVIGWGNLTVNTVSFGLSSATSRRTRRAIAGSRASSRRSSIGCGRSWASTAERRQTRSVNSTTPNVSDEASSFRVQGHNKRSRVQEFFVAARFR